MPSFKNGNEINYPHPGDSKWPFDPQTLEVTIRLWKGHGFTIPKRSRLQNCQDYMSVSENSGTPKSSILIGFSIINHPFWGTPIFGNTHILLGKLTSKISPDMGWMDRSKPWTQKKKQKSNELHEFYHNVFTGPWNSRFWTQRWRWMENDVHGVPDFNWVIFRFKILLFRDVLSPNLGSGVKSGCLQSMSTAV